MINGGGFVSHLSWWGCMAEGMIPAAKDTPPATNMNKVPNTPPAHS